MKSPGKGQVLLSMLGVVLSPAARMYLKKTNQGIMQFLAQFPHEFSVDGQRGREYVSYLPALVPGSLPVTKGNQSDGDLPGNFGHGNTCSEAVPPAFECGHATPARQTPPAMDMGVSGNISDLHHNAPPVSHMKTPGGGTPKFLQTPSDWGTPQPCGVALDPNHQHANRLAGKNDP